MNTTTKKTTEELIQTGESPLPLEVIPNSMGINLCGVESIEWTRQPDGQLVSLTIAFIPANKENDRLQGVIIAQRQPNNRKWYNSREIPAEGGREMNFGELILNEPIVKCFASTTPETDSETNYCDAIPDMPWVDVDVARRLERERNEAREALLIIANSEPKNIGSILAQGFFDYHNLKKQEIDE